MTNDEFDVKFDVLYNNVSSNQAPGLSKYEKSVFLTQAQDLILKAYLHPATNKLLEGIGESIERDIDFSTLSDIAKYTTFEDNPIELLNSNDTWHKVVKRDSTKGTILYILNETVSVLRGNKTIELQCIPISHDEYESIQSRAYRFPKRYLAWRITNSNASATYYELIAGYEDNIQQYTIKFIRKPRPIILENLASGLSIDNKNTVSTCELDEILHYDILVRAVELARAAYNPGVVKDAITIGNISATNLGVVPLNNKE